MSVERETAYLLIHHKKTLSVAESCTGGGLSNRLTNIAGSSYFFKLGLVVYSNEAKIKFLKVPSPLLIKHSAVSRQVAKHMAQAVRKILRTDFGIAVTGIAGPGGSTRNKPVGLAFIALSTKNETVCEQFIFKGNRLNIKSQAATQALTMLLKFLEK